MKILMTLMGLDIGGAETHVVELSKELKRQGHEVAIVSNGGTYQREIEEAGIPHYQAPLHNRKLSNMLKSYQIIQQAIREMKPDIVHAHARIPALVCHYIAKFDKSFEFVTSVHGHFSTQGKLRWLSRWGKKTMAVSEDLRRYLLQNYKVEDKNIYITVNGIDTERFNNRLTGIEVMEEFHLNVNATRVVYVSRLDRDVCSPAFALLEIVPQLLEEIPDLEILIVGNGDAFAELKGMAENINLRAGRNAVILTGSRTDVNQINATATFCMGVSRAILEGMAEGKPAILAGSHGYLGIFNKDMLDKAMECNFTCRGSAPLAKEQLLQDLLALYRMEPGERLALAEYSRQVVMEYYSVKKMAADNLLMYEDALSGDKYDMTILGYYGYKNSGDDALLYAIVNSLRAEKPDIKIMVLSNNPEETEKMYQVDSAYRFQFWKLSRIFKNTTLFLMGGGSLLQDGTSTKSLIYYTYCLRRAKACGARVMLYANGIGPVKRSINRKRVVSALKNVDIITLRDEDSKEDLQKMGVANQIIVTADPVFSIQDCDEDEAKFLLESYGMKQDEKYVCISIRKWKDAPENLSELFSDVGDYIVETYGYTPVFIPMQYPYDAGIIRTVVKKMKYNSIFLDNRLPVATTLGIIKGAEMVIGVRLHMLIFASAVGVPVMGIVYDPKICNFQRYIGQPYFVDPRGLVGGDYRNIIDQCMKNKHTIEAELAEILEDLHEKSELNAKIAVQLLNYEQEKGKKPDEKNNGN